MSWEEFWTLSRTVAIYYNFYFVKNLHFLRKFRFPDWKVCMVYSVKHPSFLLCIYRLWEISHVYTFKIIFPVLVSDWSNEVIQDMKANANFPFSKWNHFNFRNNFSEKLSGKQKVFCTNGTIFIQKCFGKLFPTSCT